MGDGAGRLVAVGLVALTVGACAGGPVAADVTLCREVARVTGEFVTTVGDLIGQDEANGRAERRHEVQVGGSHLLVAADGDQDGTPDDELADVVRTAGRAGTSASLETYVDALLDAEEACADAGATLDTRAFDELRLLDRDEVREAR